MRRYRTILLLIGLLLLLLPTIVLAETPEEEAWLPPTEKADLLVIAAHPDDELIFFGGTLPTYAGERGLTVQVAYMAHGVDEARIREAKAGLWHCGVKNEPVFLGYRDVYSESLETSERQWGRDKVTGDIVEMIRRFKPEVIVTHDLNGEYGHGAHRLTAACTLDAFTLAADVTAYPESLAKYGVWQPQKLYLHLFEGDPVTMDWRQPLAAFDGRTALTVAQEAFDMHVSQQDYAFTVTDEGKTSCAQFGLAASMVGAEQGENDFFSCIPPDRLTTGDNVAQTVTTDAPKLTVLLPADSSALADHLTDGSVLTYATLRAGETVSAYFHTPMAALYISFHDLPSQYALTYYSSDGKEIAAENYPGALLNAFHLLPSDCASVAITVSDASALSDVQAYAAADEIPVEVERWESAPAHADLLLICANPGDAFTVFSGLLPQYAMGHSIRTAVVYMSDLDRRGRMEESLNGLWSLGIREYPIISPLHSPNDGNYDVVKKYWKKTETRQWLRDLIVRLAPTVVVTPGCGSELPGSQRFTAEMAAEVVSSLAAEGEQSVKKLYQCSSLGSTTPDFSVPLAACGGISSLDAARNAFAHFPSLLATGASVPETVSFSLVYSAVGTDEVCNDLFEHIDPSLLERYTPLERAVQETPGPVAPTAEATTLPAETPSASEPTSDTMADAPDMPDMQTEPAPDKTETPLPWFLLPLLIGALASLLLLTRFGNGETGEKPRRVMVFAALVPVALGAVLTLVLLPKGVTGEAASIGTAPAMETATPSMDVPRGTIAPNVTPVPEKIEQPETTEAPVPEDSDGAQSIQPGQPEEVVFDPENGHWSYRSDSISVSIDRVATEYDGDPVVYFAADIRMKDVYQYHNAWSADDHCGRGGKLPTLMAAETRSVLLITGDNMVNNEREEKGILIRDGRIYSGLHNEDTLALYPDMSLRIIKKRTTDAETLLSTGVQDAFSFGPTLMENGVINDRAKYHRTRRLNPRTAIGMYEPGHYLAIVVDGRQRLSGYSVGMTLWDLASLFEEYGCTDAYNLDGGVSAAMIFMGEQINHHSGQRMGDPNDISFQRPLPDALCFGYSELVPTVDELSNGEIG